jgi:hypothetical protein
MDASARVAPPPWAVVAAYTVPLCVLPSAVWRSWLFVDGTVGLDAEGLYLLTLTVASVGLALLTLGLVQPWGERMPPWVPVLGGRSIPVRAVVIPALSGALLLIGLSIFIVLDEVFQLVGPGPVVIGPSGPDVAAHPEPDGRVMALYLPMLGWGPLLLALGIDYLRRRQRPLTAASTEAVRPGR